jgi:hypothetical protein
VEYKTTITKLLMLAFLPVAQGLLTSCPVLASSSLQTSAPSQGAIVRRAGAIKEINGGTLVVAPDSGPEFAVAVSDSAKLLRIAPGEKNLQNATPFQLQDLQVGDRVLASGPPSADGNSIFAVSLVLMKRADVDATHQQERQDWQKRGIGGLVSTFDTATGTITISVTGFGGTKSIAIHTSKDTIIRRYAPDSVKFEDAKPSTLQEIHAGDQLRARGERSADGSELTAQEIVSGSFRNIAGTVISADASAGTLSVQDLLSKKSVQVKVSNDSQLRKLPPEVAQRMAARFKGMSVTGAAGGRAGASAIGEGSSLQTAAGNSSPTPGGGSGGWQGRQGADGPAGNGGGMRGGAAPDLQQMLSRMPAASLADLKKGDAVLIVATEGIASNGGTAITLVAGVEPILQAVPTAGQAMMLAPWSLSAPAGGDAASQ